MSSNSCAECEVRAVVPDIFENASDDLAACVLCPATPLSLALVETSATVERSELVSRQNYDDVELLLREGLAPARRLA